MSLLGLQCGAIFLRRRSSFLHRLFQRLACVFDVLRKNLAGGLYVSFAAERQDLMMFLIGALDSVRQVQL